MRCIIIQTCFILTLASDICLNEEEELIKTIVEEPNLRGLERRQVMFRKFKVPREVDITIFKASQTSVYCPATLNILSDEKCHKQEKVIVYDSETSQEICRRSQCLVGQVCSQSDCDGVSRATCFDTRLDRWLDGQSETEFQLSTSYLFHRCSRGYSCQISTLKAYSYLISQTKVQLEGSIFGECIMDISDRVCRGRSNWTVVLKDILEAKQSEIVLPCLKGQKDELCWDEEENNDFTLVDQVSQNENVYYETSAEVIYKHHAEPLFSNSLANLKDVEAIYRILQYENLQTNYNIVQLRKDVFRVKELLVGLLFNQLGLFKDPLQNIRSTFGKVTQWNKTHLSMSACRTTRQAPGTNGPLKEDKIVSSFSLFPSQDFSENQYGSKRFRILTYGDAEIENIIRSKETSENFDVHSDLNGGIITIFSGLKEWITGWQTCFFWICSLLSLVLAKIVILNAKQ